MEVRRPPLVWMLPEGPNLYSEAPVGIWGPQTWGSATDPESRLISTAGHTLQSLTAAHKQLWHVGHRYGYSNLL